MPIEFRCTQCGKLLRTPDETGGQQAKCPACGAVVTVPMPTTLAGPSGMEETYGLASDYGADAAVNPYQAPAELTMGATPFATGGAAGVIRPTQIEFGDVLAKTWRIFIDHFGMCLAVGAVCLIINVVVGEVPKQVGKAAAVAVGPAALVVFTLTYLVVQVFTLWLRIGMTIFFINTARGRTAKFTNIFAGGPYLLRAIGATILYILAILAIVGACLLPAAVFGGMGEKEAAEMALFGGTLVAMPFVIALWLTFFPFLYLIIDQNLGIIEAFGEARRITSGNRLIALAIFLITGIACGLLALVTCLIGLFVVVPYMAMLIAVIYLLMSGQQTAAEQMEQTVHELPPVAGP